MFAARRIRYTRAVLECAQCLVGRHVGRAGQHQGVAPVHGRGFVCSRVSRQRASNNLE